jgi:DNA-binding NarL/FixJ family response regulator
MIRLIIIMKQAHDLDRVMEAVGSQADLTVIGIGSDYYRAIKLAQAEQPDIAVIDYQFDCGGLDVVTVVKRKSPGTSVILISPYDDEWRARDALIRGVSGYLLQNWDISILAGVIYMVHAGGYYISHRIVARTFRALPKFRMYRDFYRGRLPQGKGPARGCPGGAVPLSQTEWQIILLVGQGRNTKEISESLNLKMGTVRNYISNMMRKTGIHNRHRMALSLLEGGSPPGRQANLRDKCPVNCQDC